MGWRASRPQCSYRECFHEGMIVQGLSERMHVHARSSSSSSSSRSSSSRSSSSSKADNRPVCMGAAVHGTAEHRGAARLCCQRLLRLHGPSRSALRGVERKLFQHLPQVLREVLSQLLSSAELRSQWDGLGG